MSTTYRIGMSSTASKLLAWPTVIRCFNIVPKHFNLTCFQKGAHFEAFYFGPLRQRSSQSA